jgi:hypothetical protein
MDAAADVARDDVVHGDADVGRKRPAKPRRQVGHGALQRIGGSGSA